MSPSKNKPGDQIDIKGVFRALEHRNYRLFFMGQGISLVGTWMQQVAMSWLVYRLTNSAFLLGFIVFLSQIPAFILTPFAGVIADRYNRHRMLIVTQTIAMIQALILSVLVLTHKIAIWHIAGLGVLLGIVNAFDIPIRHAFTVEMIERKEDLGNAIALNSSMFNLARLIGPSIAGILIGLAGEGVCFSLNAISYLAVIVSLCAMKITHSKRELRNTPVMHDLKEGLVYVLGFKPIVYILLLLALVSLMGVPYQVLMPVFARDIFHGGPHTLGFLITMSGVGALIGALYLAMRRSIVGLGKTIALTTAIFGVGLVCFSLSKILWFSMACVLVSGFGMMVQMSASNTILQTIVDEDKRGRIMSFYAMSFMGMAPIGSLLAGSLANRIGAPYTVLIGGSFCILCSFIFARQLPAIRKKIRPIYAEKGIIPEVASGIQSATQFGIFSKD